MAQTNCRLPDPLDEKLEEAADERQAFKSEIVRRSIRFYVKKNPDGIRALKHPSDRKRRTGPNGDRTGAGTSTGASEGRRSGDRAGRVREETLELDRDGEADQEESGNTAGTRQNRRKDHESDRSVGHAISDENGSGDGETDDSEASGSAVYDPTTEV